MFHLILFGPYCSLIIPEYSSEEACYEAAKVWEHKAKYIPAPAFKYPESCSTVGDGMLFCK